MPDELLDRVAKVEQEVALIKGTTNFKLDALSARVAQVEVRLGVASILGMALGQIIGRWL